MTKCCFIAFISSIYLFSHSLVLAGIDDGLIAFFPFENNANDSSNNGLIGKKIGNISFVSGKIGLSLYLDGDGDYIDLGNSLNLPRICSVSVWVKSLDLSRAWPAILAKYETNFYGPYDFELHYDKASVWLSTGTGSEVEVSSEKSIIENEWTHIVWTIINNKLKIYINGKLDTQADIPNMTQNNDTVTIGRQQLMCSPNDPDLQFKGYIDELRVYDRLLRVEEIEELSDEISETESSNILLLLTPILSKPKT